MPLQQGIASAASSRLEALKTKHKLLSNRIEDEQRRPSVRDFHVNELKREKLKIKEEIEGIREAS